MSKDFWMPRAIPWTARAPAAVGWPVLSTTEIGRGPVSRSKALAARAICGRPSPPGAARAPAAQPGQEEDRLAAGRNSRMQSAAARSRGRPVGDCSPPWDGSKPT